MIFRGRSGPESHGADLNVDLIEQPPIVELPHEVAPAHDPDILPAGGFRHLLVNRAHIAAHEADIGAGGIRIEE